MLSMIYSCGLRRSELLNLTKLDIDSKRMIILKNNYTYSTVDMFNNNFYVPDCWILVKRDYYEDPLLYYEFVKNV